MTTKTIGTGKKISVILSDSHIRKLGKTRCFSDSIRQAIDTGIMVDTAELATCNSLLCEIRPILEQISSGLMYEPCMTSPAFIEETITALNKCISRVSFTLEEAWKASEI